MSQTATARDTDDFTAVRRREFARLDRSGHVYLDYTGSALYPESLVRDHAAALSEQVLGNPHSESPSSDRSTGLLADARRAVLDFFEADPSDYGVVFTANASAAIKLVGESFPFTPRSALLLAADNHNSVNGLRAFAARRGARVTTLPLDRDLRLAVAELPAAGPAPGLFAFPAQSNFSGVRHSLELVARAQTLGWRVLVDAAAFVPTHPLSLREVAPNFVALSFYKMFGWPTGVGALIARRAALAELERPWFAGGTVEYVSVQHGRHQFLQSVEAFEDGTPSFLGIAAVPRGLAFLDALGMERIRDRMARLTARLLDALPPFARVYGPRTGDARGATVALNVLDREGRVLPYWEVERAAARAGISVRGGCFCNPGAAEFAFDIDAERSRTCLDRLGPGTFTPETFGRCLGGPVGAVRVSLGVPATEADLDRLITFLHHCHEELHHDTDHIARRGPRVASGRADTA